MYCGSSTPIIRSAEQYILESWRHAFVKKYFLIIPWVLIYCFTIRHFKENRFPWWTIEHVTLANSQLVNVTFSLASCDRSALFIVSDNTNMTRFSWALSCRHQGERKSEREWSRERHAFSDSEESEKERVKVWAPICIQMRSRCHWWILPAQNGLHSISCTSARHSHTITPLDILTQSHL